MSDQEKPVEFENFYQKDMKLLQDSEAETRMCLDQVLNMRGIDSRFGDMDVGKNTPSSADRLRYLPLLEDSRSSEHKACASA
uniref:Uncharacterized protein n=1 Tax=Timema bartmani TaxID=61472 RepID=A0A7R9EVQ1_9NEOP|nr:unnamed protein product [Timema bartmani]